MTPPSIGGLIQPIDGVDADAAGQTELPAARKTTTPTSGSSRKDAGVATPPAHDPALDPQRERLRTAFVDQLVSTATANFGFQQYVEKVSPV